MATFLLILGLYGCSKGEHETIEKPSELNLRFLGAEPGTPGSGPPNIEVTVDEELAESGSNDVDGEIRRKVIRIFLSGPKDMAGGRLSPSYTSKAALIEQRLVATENEKEWVDVDEIDEILQTGPLDTRFSVVRQDNGIPILDGSTTATKSSTDAVSEQRLELIVEAKFLRETPLGTTLWIRATASWGEASADAGWEHLSTDGITGAGWNQLFPDRMTDSEQAAGGQLPAQGESEIY